MSYVIFNMYYVLIITYFELQFFSQILHLLQTYSVINPLILSFVPPSKLITVLPLALFDISI